MAKEHKKRDILEGRGAFRDAFQSKYKAEGVEVRTASNMEGVQSIPTGIISFDAATGCGGFPKGRVVEIYGPESSGKSLLSLCAVAYAQKMFGATALYFDVEGGTPVEWLKTLGINLDDFDIVGAGLTAEQNYDAMVAAIESNAYTYIIVDSLAAMVPRAELEGTIDKAYMAEAARASSKGIRKIIATLGALKSDGPCCIFINQTRMKPGVMFGCFHHDAHVVLEDGSTKMIGEIVNKQLKVNVLSVNTQGQIVSSPVVDWHKNGIAESFIKFTVEDYSGPGHRQFLCTSLHEIHSKNGFKAAKTLAKGDLVYVAVEKILSMDQRQLIIGSVLGDGSLLGSNGKYTAPYREDHGLKQTEYLKWKAELLKPIISQFVVQKDRASMSSKALVELGELREKLYKNRKKVFTQEIANELNWLGIATWFLDDGTFYKTDRGGYNAELCLMGFDDKSIARIKMFFAKKLGKTPYYLPIIRTIRFLAKERNVLFENIKTFVCPCMQYKLTEECKGQFISRKPFESNPRKELMLVKIMNKTVVKHKPNMQKFDITVDGTHNYFVSGVNVHNSPEDTPGGKALKFYAAQRYRVNQKSQSQITENGDVVGHSIEVKNKKNKLGPPLREGEFFINYTQGLDTIKSIMTMLKDRKMYSKDGQKYILTIGDEKIKFDNVAAIKDELKNADFQLKVYNELISKYIGVLEGELPMSGDRELEDFPTFPGEASLKLEVDSEEL